MSPEENTDLFSLVHLMISKVDTLTGATLVAVHNGKEAGQEVPHVHVHLVPRSEDDSTGTIHSISLEFQNIKSSIKGQQCYPMQDHHQT